VSWIARGGGGSGKPHLPRAGNEETALLPKHVALSHCMLRCYADADDETGSNIASGDD
jgi:hypothetical protein